MTKLKFYWYVIIITIFFLSAAIVSYLANGYFLPQTLGMWAYRIIGAIIVSHLILKY